MIVSELVGRTLAELGVGHAFGVVGSGNFHVTNALVAGGARFVATRKPIAEVLERWEHVLFPLVLIGLGIVILVEGGAFGL